MAKRGAPLGNTNATKNKPITDAINRVLLANDGKKMRALAEALVDVAIDGEGQFGTGRVGAASQVLERVEGKVPQAISADIDMSVTLEVVKFAGSSTE